MSHRPTSPANSPDQTDAGGEFQGLPGGLISGPQSLDGSSDQVDGPKPQGLPEELVSKAPGHANPTNQSRSGPNRHVWPEEDLTSTADESGGFYSLRVGETLDDGRFVITRKLGWGGFSSVWLARDREYMLKTGGLLLTNN